MEKVLKREDGSRVKIVCRISDFSSGIKYLIEVFTCEKGKRKFNRVTRDDWQYRSMSLEDKRKALMSTYLKYHITEDELYNICNLAHEEMRPTKKNIEACTY